MQMQILITVLGSRQTNRGRRYWYEHKDTCRAGYGSHKLPVMLIRRLTAAMPKVSARHARPPRRRQQQSYMYR